MMQKTREIAVFVHRGHVAPLKGLNPDTVYYDEQIRCSLSYAATHSTFKVHIFMRALLYLNRKEKPLQCIEMSPHGSGKTQ